MQLMQGFFSTNNPFMARLWDFFQAGRVTLSDYRFTGHWDPLTASAVGQTDTISIDPSIDFILVQLNYVAFATSEPVIPNTALATPNHMLSLSEKSGALLFQDEDHHIMLWTGGGTTGRRSYALPIPRLLKGNNEILARLSDNAGTPAECWLGFEGIRVTYVNADRREVFPFLAF